MVVDLNALVNRAVTYGLREKWTLRISHKAESKLSRRYWGGERKGPELSVGSGRIGWWLHRDQCYMANQ